MEWKQGVGVVLRRGRQPLETSLVEWKLELSNAPYDFGRALETSLVEWKLRSEIRSELLSLPWKLP